MATVQVTVGTASGQGANGVALPAMDATHLAAHTLTTSGSSAQTTLGAAGRNLVVCVSVDGGDVFVSFGPSPTAGADNGFRLVDGEVRIWSLGSATKIAIKDA